MARIKAGEKAMRREVVERRERLADLSDEYAKARAAAVALGDAPEVRRLSEVFAAARTSHRIEDERLGLRGPGATVQLSTNMSHHWAKIAIKHEAEAWAAHGDYVATEDSDPTDALGRCLRASIVTITAAAFTIEGLYGSICYLLPEQTPKKSRWATIRATLLLMFDLAGVERLDARLARLFDVRDQAVHPWVSVRPPVAHPDRDVRVAVEVALFSAAEATAGADITFELLDHCSLHPLPISSRARRWADGERAGVERLLEERASAQMIANG